MFDLLQSFFEQYGMLAVFLVLIACGLGLPIPEDITLVTGGVISGLGYGNVHLMLVVSFLGVLLGDLIIFLIGYRFGHRILSFPFFRRIITPARLQQAQTKLDRHGDQVIFIARFLPGLRMPIYLATGICRNVSIVRFLMLDGLAALVSVPIWVYLGYYGAENIDWLMAKVHQFQTVTLVIMGIAALLIGYYYFFRWRRHRFFREQRKKLRLERRRKQR